MLFRSDLDATISGESMAAAAPRKRRRLALWAGIGAVAILAAVGLSFLVPKLAGRGGRFVPPSFEQLTFTFAHDEAFIYGVACVALALFTGWLAGVLFRRD